MAIMPFKRSVLVTISTPIPFGEVLNCSSAFIGLSVRPLYTHSAMHSAVSIYRQSPSTVSLFLFSGGFLLLLRGNKTLETSVADRRGETPIYPESKSFRSYTEARRAMHSITMISMIEAMSDPPDAQLQIAKGRFDAFSI
ncbi:MAG: hypothetical protein II697_01735 [Clostridia bacterium]|nr:hypothetical protein [Clostridia bacterium]